MKKFIKSQDGDVVSWVVIVPLIFFIFFFGVFYLYFDCVRAGVAMAAREGAREYGIALEDPSLPAYDMAKEKVLSILVTEGLIPEGTEVLPPTDTPAERTRGVKIVFTKKTDWVDCEVTYYLPNPFPGVFGLVGLTSPDHFTFSVKGAAKHEIIADGG